MSDEKTHEGIDKIVTKYPHGLFTLENSAKFLVTLIECKPVISDEIKTEF